jgi:hypothetical protein
MKTSKLFYKLSQALSWFEFYDLLYNKICKKNKEKYNNYFKLYIKKYIHKYDYEKNRFLFHDFTAYDNINIKKYIKLDYKYMFPYIILYCDRPNKDQIFKKIFKLDNTVLLQDVAQWSDKFEGDNLTNYSNLKLFKYKLYCINEFYLNI